MVRPLIAASMAVFLCACTALHTPPMPLQTPRFLWICQYGAGDVSALVDDWAAHGITVGVRHITDAPAFSGMWWNGADIPEAFCTHAVFFEGRHVADWVTMAGAALVGAPMWMFGYTVEVAPGRRVAIIFDDMDWVIVHEGRHLLE